MNINVAGLNKVYCFTNSSSHNGHAVTISDGTNTWTDVISSLSCVFQIPSIPAPAKKRYTVSLYNAATATGSAVYTRTIDLGFGDSIRIGLYEDDENVTKGSIPKATSSRIGGFKTYENTSNGIYMDGDYLKLKDATSSQKGGVKVPTSTSYGVYMNGSTLQTYQASSSQFGCVKIGDGIQASSGVISLPTASSSQKGGVKLGRDLGIDGDGMLQIEGYHGYNGSTYLSLSSSVYVYGRNTEGGVSDMNIKVSYYSTFNRNFFVHHRISYITLHDSDHSVELATCIPYKQIDQISHAEFRVICKAATQLDNTAESARVFW